MKSYKYRFTRRWFYFYQHYFNNQDSFFKKRFKHVLVSFFTGALSPLIIPSTKLLSLVLQKLNPQFYRGFSYEGTAIGFGIKSSFARHKGSHFEKQINQLSPASIYQYYVGLGWWLHLLYKYDQKKYSKLVNQLNPNYSHIMFDGVGFKIGLFHYIYNKQCINLFNNFSEQQKRVCFQGFGRSLWFISRFQWDVALKELNRLGQQFPYRNDILSGMGLAVAYSIFDNLFLGQKIIQSIEEKEDLAPFIQGLAFGLETRKRQDPNLWEMTIENLPKDLINYANNLIDLVHKVKDDLNKTCNNHDFYVLWIDGIRQQIKENGYAEANK
ncbi:DUF1702 family protein [Bacillus sp. SM2101]|uniref:DUF1702 family protein n=1 Tax=Bacillus sp. SM2101 TaxID=2805366 RepID=UPI001BDE4C8D|nr:DUF1702 family protein [Bacillus sp. SM2101]